jgi:hypothetical protein
MSLECEDGIIAQHSFAIIDNFEQTTPTAFDLDDNPACAGVDGVFDQLLGDRSRAFHDFTRGYLIGYVVWEESDLRHDTFGARASPPAA